MNNAMLQSFLSTALPIVIAVLFGTWANNKRLDDLARRLDRIEAVLDRIEAKLTEHGERISRLEVTRG
jgi:hypothetical protein